MSSPGMWAWQVTLEREQQDGIVTLRDDPVETTLQRRYRQLPQVRRPDSKDISEPAGSPTQRRKQPAAGSAAVRARDFSLGHKAG